MQAKIAKMLQRRDSYIAHTVVVQGMKRGSMFCLISQSLSFQHAPLRPSETFYDRFVLWGQSAGHYGALSCRAAAV